MTDAPKTSMSDDALLQQLARAEAAVDASSSAASSVRRGLCLRHSTSTPSDGAST